MTMTDQFAGRLATVLFAALPIVGLAGWAATTTDNPALWAALSSTLAVVVAFTVGGARAALAASPQPERDNNVDEPEPEPDQAPGAPAWEDLYRTLTDIYDEDRAPQ